MKKIAILGAGVMGCDVALEFSTFGYRVILKDIKQDILIKARSKMESDFRMYKMIKKEYKDIEFEEIINRILFTLDYNDFNDIDLIIENIDEDFNIKENLYRELENHCPENVIYAVNTSCIPITKIASLVKRKDKVIGVHFMNPVPLKKMVEVIKGFHTSTETIDTIIDILIEMNKTPVIVNDSPGFVANRLSHLFMNEAAFLVHENVASPKDIDLVFRKGYGHSMGPLETADLIGLDTVQRSLEVLYNNFQDSKFRCCPLIRRMVDAGLLGKKSGEGFYKYSF
ncbi:MAG: 3-hydroxybutyryl-CoA dehydrogenase [Bacteroidetes bacterium GWF2_33_16]|nr:MAG: 3-hydroxybutyryl-CoA dehydrogenase [Bacteroidetes bacterium GWE2_32_14]OFY02336.1 MAG: 3-hydroxybutyryl-CoA dehydrogenase [Bacteroidetes bacterium GWF2_33_16]